MYEKKYETLEKLSDRYHEVNEKYINDLLKKKPRLNKQASEYIDEIQKRYDQVNKMPVWPFNLNYFLRITATIGLPVVIFFGEELVKTAFQSII
jgi:hypothetical protein